MTRTAASFKIRFGAWLAGCAFALLPLFAASADQTVQSTGKNAPDITGVWQVTKYEKSIRTVDGKQPPLKPAALEEYQRNLKQRKTLRPKNDMARCVPPGIPRIMWAPLPMMVLQTERKVTFVHEYQHILRHIYLDEPAPNPASCILCQFRSLAHPPKRETWERNRGKSLRGRRLRRVRSTNATRNYGNARSATNSKG